MIENSGEKIKTLIADNENFGTDFSLLSPAQQDIVFIELSNAERGTLRNINLEWNHSPFPNSYRFSNWEEKDEGDPHFLDTFLQGLIEVSVCLGENQPQTNISLNLHDPRIGRNCARALASQLSSRVTELDLSGCRIFESGGMEICRVLNSRTLIKLNLKGNQIGGLPMHHIAQKLPESSVKELNLADNGLHSNSVCDLAYELPESEVLKLDLSGNPIYIKAVSTILEKAARSKLVELVLSKQAHGIFTIPTISDADANRITMESAEKNPKLQIKFK